jgi:glycosyltransferase involved in cell wall biosynthesis
MDPLRVMYAVFHPLPVSESYIRNEIEWMERHGVQIAIWARYPRLAAALRILGVNTGWAASRRVVSRIWAFPHFSADVAHPKVQPLPPCYASEHFFPGEPDESARQILRAGTALPGKGWEEFLEIARQCPEIRFAAALAVPDTRYADALVAAAPSNIRFYRDLQRDECAELMRSSWACLRAHDPASHRYGMPISIAEALGCGLPVIARRAPEAEAYIGAAGTYYSTLEESIAIVRDIVSWSRARWESARTLALSQARLYTADANLPRVLAHWREIAGV